MNDRTRHVTFMADQALSSILTFVVLTSWHDSAVRSKSDRLP